MNRPSHIQKIWAVRNLTPMKRSTGKLIGDGSYEIVFVASGGYRAIRRHGKEEVSSGIHLACQADIPLKLELQPHTEIIFFKLAPWNMACLTKENMTHGLNKTVELKEVNPYLYHRLKDLDPISEAVELRTIIDIYIDVQLKVSKLPGILSLICKKFGDSSESFKDQKTSILDELKISNRKLETDFSRSVGLSPQRFYNLLRLRKISEELKSKDRSRSLSAIAHEAGYFDQAHFNRIFKAFWGVTPRQLHLQDTLITDPVIDEEYFIL